MRLCRFFCSSLEGRTALLDAEQSRHLAKVLRLSVGDSVELIDGKGCIASAAINEIGRNQVRLTLLEKHCTPAKTAGRLILAVSIAKGERFDWLIEKCTELGCDHIAAVRYHNTVKMGKESTIERAKKIAIAAAKQSSRVFLPTLTGPTTFEQSITELSGLYPESIVAYGDPAGQPLEKRLPLPRPDVIVCIGPEGGFSSEERDLLAQRNAAALCINDGILRIETAAVAFCAVLNGVQ